MAASVDGKFGSIRDLVGGESSFTSSTAPDLYRYCQCLKTVTEDTSRDLSWAVDVTTLRTGTGPNTIFKDFAEGVYPTKLKTPYIEGILDGLEDGFPLLSYFRPYLADVLGNKLNKPKNPSDTSITITNSRELGDSIRSYMASKVPASLVLAGSKAGNITSEDNSEYPGMNSYLKKTQIQLRRDDVADVMSAMNAKEAVLKVVKATPFFSNYGTWDEMNSHKGDGNLFQSSDAGSIEFAKLSKYFDGSKIRVNWDSVKNWLFSTTQQTPASILKAFIKT